MHGIQLLSLVIVGLSVSLAASLVVIRSGSNEMHGVAFAAVGLALGVLFGLLTQGTLWLLPFVGFGLGLSMLPMFKVIPYVDHNRHPRTTLLVAIGVAAGLAGTGLVAWSHRFGALDWTGMLIVTLFMSMGIWGALYNTFYLVAAGWKVLRLQIDAGTLLASV